MKFTNVQNENSLSATLQNETRCFADENRSIEPKYAKTVETFHQILQITCIYRLRHPDCWSNVSDKLKNTIRRERKPLTARILDNKIAISAVDQYKTIQFIVFFGSETAKDFPILTSHALGYAALLLLVLPDDALA